MNTPGISSTPQTIIATQSIGAPFTPEGEVMPLGQLQADTLSDLVHGDGLALVDHAPFPFTDCYEVTLEDGSLCVLDPDGSITEL